MVKVNQVEPSSAAIAKKFREPTAIPLHERLSCSIAEGRQFIGAGRTRFYEMMNEGLIDTYKNGRRRLVVVRSLIELPERLSARDALKTQ